MLIKIIIDRLMGNFLHGTYILNIKKVDAWKERIIDISCPKHFIFDHKIDLHGLL